MNYKIKLYAMTLTCKARLGCGLCGCAARPAPYIVKHMRATPHTKRERQNYQWGWRPKAAPIGTVVGASAASAPFVCVVWRACA